MNQQRTRELGDGLSASLRRLALRHDVPSGWTRCSAALSDLDEWRTRLSGWLLREFDEAPSRTADAYLVAWYLHVPAQVGAQLLHHERRVPSLRPEDLAFHLGDGQPYPDGLAVLGTGFCCLPTDPASATSGATTVRDERALAAVLRARYTAHAARFVQAYGPLSRFGPRTLWAAATDALENALWSAGREGGTPSAEGAGMADAALVLDARYPPLTSASTLRLVERQWTRRRQNCCFSYLLPGEQECDGCPRTAQRGQAGSRPAAPSARCSGNASPDTSTAGP
ncbi:(2Fe-2S)-binding protein [Amycolatopsis sp. OK19-0408]|uniref:(2Fe-2S)-binding protein n=1 Tax=Amycolatopsis iheyensis TaxID=2945988 RepID=A0A9X2N758_9PSEU|nr:(2Fe-2S)-binding protein [Amycolatopsis iheyensis]MCR6481474.1 (2Fe-2S)-binding protein [Amycolatopsis iheyensis]